MPDIERSSDDLVAAVSHKLAFNERAYGKAWTGEDEDTRFIVQPLLDDVERLREALTFYAERSNWTAVNPPGTGAPCWHDHGQRAKAALDG